MMWGRCKENGLWIAKSADWRVLFRGHDALYIAAGRLRFRLMKPFSPFSSNHRQGDHG